MWLCDLERAIADLHPICPDYVFTKIVPAGSGIAFYTSHHTRILYWRCGNIGQIAERYNNGEVKVLKEFR